MKYPIAKGVFDILPYDPSPDGKWRVSHLWQYVEEVMRKLAESYGYKEIRTPIFERTELFVRSVGEGSDIAMKEMYTFEDKAERLMTLRPEGTAAVMRAFIEKRLDMHIGCQKLYYIGPMFRYERPQAGRYRQHHQFGVEAIGMACAEQDVELIDLLCELYRRLGITNFTILLNSVGDLSTRKQYQVALRTYLQPRFQELSEESKLRFEKNILRILDSKDAKDQEILKSAPSLLDFQEGEVKEHFEKVQYFLKKLKIPFVLSPKLVRGLDYYNKTVFEITSEGLGSQNAIGAGGRYDGLLALLGGPSMPAVGFAAGLERILQTMLAQKVSLPTPVHPKIFFIPLGDEAKAFCMELIFYLRHENIFSEIDWYPKKVGKSLEKAAQLQSTYAVVFGEDELISKKIKLKKLATHEEISLGVEELINFLRS